MKIKIRYEEVEWTVITKDRVFVTRVMRVQALHTHIHTQIHTKQAM
jgi:hypothetical protein